VHLLLCHRNLTCTVCCPADSWHRLEVIQTTIYTAMAFSLYPCVAPAMQLRVLPCHFRSLLTCTPAHLTETQLHVGMHAGSLARDACLLSCMLETHHMACAWSQSCRFAPVHACCLGACASRPTLALPCTALLCTKVSTRTQHTSPTVNPND
jgi:hypothetical protein